MRFQSPPRAALRCGAILVVALAAMHTSLAQRPGGPRAEVTQYVGKPLPDVTVHDADGAPFRMDSLRGSHAVIIFGCLT